MVLETLLLTASLAASPNMQMQYETPAQIFFAGGGITKLPMPQAKLGAERRTTRLFGNDITYDVLEASDFNLTMNGIVFPPQSKSALIQRGGGSVIIHNTTRYRQQGELFLEVFDQIQENIGDARRIVGPVLRQMVREEDPARKKEMIELILQVEHDSALIRGWNPLVTERGIGDDEVERYAKASMYHRELALVTSLAIQTGQCPRMLKKYQRTRGMDKWLNLHNAAHQRFIGLLVAGQEEGEADYSELTLAELLNPLARIPKMEDVGFQDASKYGSGLLLLHALREEFDTRNDLAAVCLFGKQSPKDKRDAYSNWLGNYGTSFPDRIPNLTPQN